MASGHADWQTWAGRSVGGEDVVTLSFSADINSENQGYFDIGPIPSGYRYTFQNITVSCNDDSSIHNVFIKRLSDDLIFFEVNFINGGIFDFPGQAFGEGETIRFVITNRSANNLKFTGSISYTSTKI